MRLFRLHVQSRSAKDKFWYIRKRPENGKLVTRWRNHTNQRTIGNVGNRGNHKATATVVTKSGHACTQIFM